MTYRLKNLIKGAASINFNFGGRTLDEFNKEVADRVEATRQRASAENIPEDVALKTSFREVLFGQTLMFSALLGLLGLAVWQGLEDNALGAGLCMGFAMVLVWQIKKLNISHSSRR